MITPILTAVGAGLATTAVTAGSDLRKASEWPAPLRFWKSIYSIDNTGDKPVPKVIWLNAAKAIALIVALSLFFGWLLGSIGAWGGAFLGAIVAAYVPPAFG